MYKPRNVLHSACTGLLSCALFANAFVVSHLAHAATTPSTIQPATTKPAITPVTAPVTTAATPVPSITTPAEPATATSKGNEVATVEIESTISGNVEQPKTIYVMPWQEPIASIKLPAPDLALPEPALQPLDREQFLQFMQAQPVEAISDAMTDAATAPHGSGAE